MSVSNSIALWSTDATGRTLARGSAIVDSFVYHPTDDISWGDISTLSWYKAPTHPDDGFFWALNNQNRWSSFTSFGNASVTVSSGVLFTISGSKARGGLTSENIWNVSGDFEITLYIDNNLYYNEYRSSASVGIVLSKDDSNKVRASRYFDIDDEVIGYGIHTVSGVPLQYVGWTEHTLVEKSISTDIDCIRLERTGDSLVVTALSKVDETTVYSGIDISFLGDSLYVSIEAETDQYNIFEAGVSGLTISGTVTPSTLDMSDEFRSTYRAFPTDVLLIGNTDGISIVDHSSFEVWARLENTDNYVFLSASGVVCAAGDSIVSTTTSGCSVADFSNDSIRLYTADGYWEKHGPISVASANTFTTFTTQSKPCVRGNYVTCADVGYFGGNKYYIVGTDTGVSVFSSTAVAGYSTTSDEVTSVCLSNDGFVWWHEYDPSSGEGVLYYVRDVSSCVNSDFSPNGSFSMSDVSGISSNKINALSCRDGFVVVAHDYGLDVIGGPYIRRLGYSLASERVVGGDFSSDPGVHWDIEYSGVSNNYFVRKDTHWSGSGYCMSVGFDGTLKVLSGDAVYIKQTINMTNIGTVYYDLRTVNTPGDQVGYQVVIKVDNKTIHTYDIPPMIVTHSSESIDISGYDGSHTVSFGLVATSSFVPVSGVYVQFAGVTTLPVNYTERVLSSNKPVLDCSILGSYGALKAAYATDDGYGIVDLHEYTEDFFYDYGGVESFTLHV